MRNALVQHLRVNPFFSIYSGKCLLFQGIAKNIRQMDWRLLKRSSKQPIEKMRIILYIIGAIILLGAACFAATLIGVPPLWVGIIGAVILGLGIMGAANSASGVKSTEDRSTIITKVD